MPVSKYNRNRPYQYQKRNETSAYRRGDIFKEEGMFVSARFQSETNSFVIATFEPKNNEKIVCKGDVPGFVVGAPYEVEGEVIDDPTWGVQVTITSATAIRPSSSDEIISFLGSGNIRGIGPRTATRIYDTFGDDTLNILEDEPERLLEVRGIGEKMIPRIVKDLEYHLQFRNIIGFFASLGVSTTTINTLIKHYGKQARDIVEENPYVLCKVRGFAFARADSIAMKMGFDKRSMKRLYAGCLATLRWICENNGHTVVSRDDLVGEAKTKLSVFDDDLISEALNLLIKDERIVSTEYGLQLTYLNKAEETIKQMVASSCKKKHNIVPRQQLDRLIDRTEKERGKTLTDEQRGAIYNAASRRLSILSGTPGGGKTSTCAVLAGAMSKAGVNVCLVSPTGRAAKRLSEECDLPGYTIHRALSIIVKEKDDTDFFNEDAVGTFRTKQTNEAIEAFKKAELVLADEASMMDTEMAALLFKACRRKHLVLVGDPNQLPAVGCGQVLRDLMASSYATGNNGMMTQLTKVFRQKEGSPVIEAAHAIINGKSPVNIPGIKFYECDNDQVQDIIGNKVIPIIKRNKMNYDEFMILSPIKKTKISGVNALNEFLRPQLNEYYKKSAVERENEPMALQRGDFVMQIKNNYECDIFNGDIGRVDTVRGNGDIYVDFKGQEDLICFTRQEARENLISAYASTVHKQQGCEADLVVVVCTSAQSSMLNRNLLYTAVTRTKNTLILVGDREAFAMAARNKKENSRNTGLQDL